MVNKFQVRKLSHSIPQKGIYVAKHNDGLLVAKSKIDFGNASIFDLNIAEGISEESVKKIEKSTSLFQNCLKKLDPICRQGN